MNQMLSGFVVLVRICWCFSFLSVGDWGGCDIFPYRSPIEVRIADSMGKVAEEQNSTFVLALGDNFYPQGVQDEFDPRFQQTFEDVFTAPSLQIPWYVLAGNHDRYGNNSAQIAYSRHSSRWTYPAPYYDFSIKLPDGNELYIIMIDTVIAAGHSRDNGTEFESAANVHLAQKQYDWIERKLAASNADFILVCGHYPIWSIGGHGPTDALLAKLRPMLIYYRVTAYFSAHDHVLQYIDDKSGVVYVGNGAGNDCNLSTEHEGDVPSNSVKFHGCSAGGFVEVSISDSNMQFNFHYGDQENPVYTSPLLKKRDKRIMSNSLFGGSFRRFAHPFQKIG